MSGDIRQFLETQRSEILKEKRRLDLLGTLLADENKENLIKQANEGLKGRPIGRQEAAERDGPEGTNSDDNSREYGHFPHDLTRNCIDQSPRKDPKCVDEEDPKFEVPSVVGPLDLGRCYDLGLEGRKQALIERLANSEGPFSYRSSDEEAGFRVLGGGAPFGLPSLRRGEYAPSRHARLRSAPHEGLGEYEIGRGLDARKNRDFLRHVAKTNRSTVKEVLTGVVEKERVEDSPKSTRGTNTELSIDSKAVQTDIQNINSELVVKHDRRYETTSHEVVLKPRRTATDELVDAALRRRSPFRTDHVDQRLTSEQNELLFRVASATNAAMDKPKSILSNRRTGSPRDRYNTTDLGHASSYNPTFMDGFSYSDRTDELERERLKRETYQHELRLQIEEKRHLAALRDEQERRERDLESRRLEQQLMRMRDEQAQEDQRRQRRNDLMRRHSDDMLRRKTELHELQRPWRRHADSESANVDALGLGATSSSYLGGYSPPVARRGLTPVSPYSSSAYNVPATSVFPDSSTTRYNANRFDSSSYPGGILRKTDAGAASAGLRRLESVNSYDTVPLPRGHRTKFDRFDSLSRIDSLSHRMETMSVRDGFGSDLTDVQRRHSATQQDLNLSRSPRLRRRNSSSRFDDALPVPVLKARSPVAKELRNAVPFSSQRSSEAYRRLEDRWQVPAVQKGILHPSSSASLDSPIGSRGSILTQLSSIRAQLQREQLRMDESLRRRGLLRTRTTEDY